MKILLHLFLFVSLISTISAQNAYLDAQVITQFSDEFRREAPQLLASDNWEVDSIDRHKIENFLHFLENPFDQNIEPFDVQEIYDLWDVVYTEAIGYKKDQLEEIRFKKEDMESIPRQSAPALAPGGLSFATRVIDATAQFLVNRSKKELTISFFNKFQDQLNQVHQIPLSENTQMEVRLKSILPATYLLLDSRQYFDTPSLGKTWITAFKKDIAALPLSIENTLKLSPDFNHTKIGRFTLAFFDIIEKVEQGYHPMDVVENAANTYQQYRQYSIDQYLGLLGLIAMNTIDFDENNFRKWVRPGTLRNMDDMNATYYLGLIYQQGLQKGLFEQIHLTDSLTLNNAINIKNHEHFFSLVKHLMTNLERIEHHLSIAKDSINSDRTALSAYLNYTNTVYSIVDNMVEDTYGLVGTDAYYQSDYYQKFRPVAYDISNFNRSLGNENYGESLLTTISFLKHLSDGNKEMDGFIKPLTYYANFLIDIIAASENESIDIKGIIENYALPVGSYRIKRHNNTSIDLNAYPGLYAGYEFSGSNSSNIGVTAPIGFSFSWRSQLTGESSASNSIFLSALDIGAPFSFRFADDSANGFPEDIKWEQIFSPGLFYIYGFKNAPLAFAMGCQYTPLLRKIEVDQVVNQESVLRFSLSLNVDIPIFNFRRN